MKNDIGKNKANPNNVGNAANSKGTFIIKVEYCQNNTWQGRITWAEENKKVAFRSMLEMVKLMNEALERTRIENERKTENSVS